MRPLINAVDIGGPIQIDQVGDHGMRSLEAFASTLLGETCNDWHNDAFDAFGLTNFDRVGDLSVQLAGEALTFSDYKYHPYRAYAELASREDRFDYFEFELRGYGKIGRHSLDIRAVRDRRSQ